MDYLFSCLLRNWFVSLREAQQSCSYFYSTSLDNIFWMSSFRFPQHRRCNLSRTEVHQLAHLRPNLPRFLAGQLFRVFSQSSLADWLRMRFAPPCRTMARRLVVVLQAVALDLKAAHGMSENLIRVWFEVCLPGQSDVPATVDVDTTCCSLPQIAMFEESGSTLIGWLRSRWQSGSCASCWTARCSQTFQSRPIDGSFSAFVYIGDTPWWQPMTAK